MAEQVDAQTLTDLVRLALTVSGAAIVASIGSLVGTVLSNRNVRKVAEDSNKTALELANQAHRNTVSLKLFDDRCRLLLDISNYVTDLETTASGYLRQLTIRNQIPDGEAARTRATEVVDGRHKEWIEATKHQQRTAGLLKLLDEKAAYEAFQTHTNAMNEIVDTTDAKRSAVTALYCNERIDTMEENSETFFTELAKAYERSE
ncbi:MAG: hypothetical protein GY947_09320 [Rhodobacteraceae bacterium]|nr:hypothetical protein [Paracoccaceae bacterium]